MNNSISLRKVVTYSKSRIKAENVSLEDFVTTDNMLQNKAGIADAVNLPPQGNAMPAYNSNNILVANIRPYLKKIWFANKNGGCSADVLVFEVKKEYDPKFVYYSLFRDDFFDHMMRGSKGTKMPRGDKDQILDFTIPHFKLIDQKKIAETLSSLDSKIEVNNRINNKLEAVAKLLYENWFVQFDFPNSIGKPYKTSGGKMIWNSDLAREVPEGWEVTELRKYLTSNRGVSYNGKDIKGKGVPMINLNAFNINSTYKPEGIKSFSGPYSFSKVLNPFDLVMCNTQQTALDPKKDIIGKSFLVPDIFETEIVSTHHVTTINVKTDNLKYYFNSLFSTEYFHRYISGYAAGTNILGLNFEGVLSYRAAIPNDELLSKYKAIVENVERQKSKIIKENKKLTELRDWLLPMLMNGQVKIK